jgi:hypothetical protein
MKKVFQNYYRYILDGAIPSKEEQIVFSILQDFTDRRGLKQEWNNIDEDIQEEIIKTWIKMTKKILK